MLKKIFELKILLLTIGIVLLIHGLGYTYDNLRLLRVPSIFDDERQELEEPWKTALENSKRPPEKLITEFRYETEGYRDVYDIKAAIEQAGVSVSDWEIPIPQNLNEIVKGFLDRNPWANGHGYSVEELQRIVSSLPSYLKVFAINFQGTGNPHDPALVVIGGIHPNEKASISSTVWFIDRMLEDSSQQTKNNPKSLIFTQGDLIFLKEYFSHIIVVVPFSPIGYSLGLRMGWNGDMTRFIEAFASEETRNLLADRADSPEMRDGLLKRPVKPSPEHEKCIEYLKASLGTDFPYRKKLLVIELHDFNLQTKDSKTGESFLVADGDISREAIEYIGKRWGFELERAGFTLGSVEGLPFREKVTDGVAVSNILNSDVNPGLDFHMVLSIESGSNELGKRMQAHHISLVSIAEAIIKLFQQGGSVSSFHRVQNSTVNSSL